MSSNIHLFCDSSICYEITDYGGGLEAVKRQTWVACGCLAARFKVSCARGLAYGLLAVRPLCNTTAPLQLQLLLI